MLSDLLPTMPRFRSRRSSCLPLLAFLCLFVSLSAQTAPTGGIRGVVVNEATVTVMTAKSQSMRAMGRVEFQRSKEAVLDVVAQMIGVKRDALAANAGKAA